MQNFWGHIFKCSQVINFRVHTLSRILIFGNAHGVREYAISEHFVAQCFLPPIAQWGSTTALFVLKIKGDNYMIASWNFIYKYIGPSYIKSKIYHDQKVPKSTKSEKNPMFEILWKLTIETSQKMELIPTL